MTVGGFIVGSGREKSRLLCHRRLVHGMHHLGWWNGRLGTPALIYSGRKDLFSRFLLFDRQAARDKLNSVVRVVRTGPPAQVLLFLVKPSRFIPAKQLELCVG
jgi:hypothetical protein